MNLFNVPIDQLLIMVMFVFCRVGGCVMVAPGFSVARLNMQIRLFIALAFSLALVPLVADQLYNLVKGLNVTTLVLGIVAESLVGVSFGVIAHAYLWAFQFMANVIGMSMGYSGQPGNSVMESVPETQIANLLMMGAVMLFFASDMHLMVLRGLWNSYDLVPVSLVPHPGFALIDYRDALSKAFLVTLRIGAPYLVYTIFVNMAVGLLNKLTPAIPIYFISLPFVVAGGLLLLYFLVPEMLRFFDGELASWLEEG
ncbi:flagellar biosynthetic protein FliR [Bartonella sp. DGB2]|uniref:flagellar biosynthetic protein FliR n=1 Tax=Bartonella sp. DGB2 TaxID=3388426 RepID=UPI00398F9F99